MINKIIDTFDYLLLRLWKWRWDKKFKETPELLIPFIITMDSWAKKSLTEEELKKCHDRWNKAINEIED